MKREVYKHLLKTYGNLPLLWIGIIAEIIKTILLRIVVVVMMALIASNLVAGDIEVAKRNTFIFVVVYIVGALIGVGGELLSVWTTDKRYKTLLANYYQRLISKDMSFYRDNQTGYLAGLFRQHLDGTMALVRLYRGDIVRMFVALVFPVLVLFIVKWQIGVVVAVIVIILSFYVLWSSRRANVYRKPAQEIYRKLTGEVADEVTNAVAFKSSGGETEAYSKVLQLADQEMKMFWLRHKATTLLDLPRTLLTGIGIGLGFLIVFTSTSVATESIGLIILIFTYLLQIMQSVADLPDLVLRHDEHIARVYPTLEYLTNSNETIIDSKEPETLNIQNGSILIKNVKFSYKSKNTDKEVKSIFDNLNIEIKGGEHVGLVGLSGAGKSTLAGLLMRFDDVDSGSILIDKIDIRNVRQDDLRQKIAYVPQEPLLFHRSIKENIGYFKKNASDEEIIIAAKIAHAHEFIVRLNDGYNTLVGDRGIKLSGGQKQRIAIARAILKNAPIIIFDEATSALDSESERIIQNALPEIIKDCTAIVIAHRLSTIARLDRIIVMHEGKIIEQGTHEELLVMGGMYHSLWKKQVTRE
jgi:ATP-binding cassette subfamily B protein